MESTAGAKGDVVGVTVTLDSQLVNPGWISMGITVCHDPAVLELAGGPVYTAEALGSALTLDFLPIGKESRPELNPEGNGFDFNLNYPVALPAGAITEKTMYDAREGKSVTVTEVDVALLNSSGQFPTNGLMYAYRTDVSEKQPNGIRRKNGAEVVRPLTVVSEDPVYVHGDFNTVNKKGDAVMADAVNLASNAWDDPKTASSTLPSASNTSFNLTIVTGKVATPGGGGSYSGGFENLPRFHEN